MDHRNQKLIAELRKILDSKSDLQVLQPYSSHKETTLHRKDQKGTKVVQILPIGRDCLKTSRLKFVPTTYTNIAHKNAKNARYLNLPTTPLATVEKIKLSPLFTPFVRPYDKEASLKNYQSLFSEKVRDEARLAIAFCTKKSVLVTISERLRKICDGERSIRQEISEDKSCSGGQGPTWAVAPLMKSCSTDKPSAPTRLDISQAVIDGNRNLDVAGLEEWLDHTLSSVEKNSSNYTETGSSTAATIDRRNKYSNGLNLDKRSSFCSEIERTGLRLDRVEDSKDESFATSQGHLDPTSWIFSQEDIRVDDKINVENWFQDDVITPTSSKKIHSLNRYAFSANHPADEPKENELLFQTPPRNFNQFQNDGAEIHIPVDCETLFSPDFNNPNPVNWTSSANSKSLLVEIFPEIESPSFRATKPASFHRAQRIRSENFSNNETDLSLINFQTNEVSWTIPAMETNSSFSISNSDNRSVGIFSQLESISKSQRGMSCRKRKLIDRTRDDDGICTVFSGATPSERNGNSSGNYNNNINAQPSVDSVIGNSFENMEYEWNFRETRRIGLTESCDRATQF